MSRDHEILERRIRGETLREIGQEFDLSPEGVRGIVKRATHDHIARLVAEMWSAQRSGQALVLAVPSWADAGDQAAVVDYLRWVLRELDRLWDVQPVIEYRPTLDGAFVFALTDPAMPVKGA